MSPWYHAVSSANKFGGSPDDYIAIHNWFDETKAYTGDFTHRALRHHSAGVEEAIRVFGHAVRTCNAQNVPVKVVAEQHVIEDCGFIPTVHDWLAPIKQYPEKWMLRVSARSKELEAPAGKEEYGS